MKQIGIGVIGWGFMGKTHTHALRSIPLFYPDAGFAPRLVKVCSRTPGKAERAAQEMGFESYTENYMDVMEDENVDVVSICTPNEWHEEMALAALAHGKHVYIDKPLACNGTSALRIAEAAKKANVKTCMVFNNRCTPAILRAKELIDDGRIGNVLSFEARYLHSGSVDPNKPIGWKQELQGGALLDMGSHALDLVTWLCGYPKRAMCRTRTLYASRPVKGGGMTSALSDDQALMLLELPNGALGTVESSKIATGTDDEFTLEIRGDQGALKWNAMDPSYLYYYDATLPERPLGGLRGFTAIEAVGRYPAPGGSFFPPKNAIGWERGHIHCYYSFLDCVANDKPVENDIAAGARLQVLMDALLQSAADRAWVEL